MILFTNKGRNTRPLQKKKHRKEDVCNLFFGPGILEMFSRFDHSNKLINISRPIFFGHPAGNFTDVMQG